MVEDIWVSTKTRRTAEWTTCPIEMASATALIARTGTFVMAEVDSWRGGWRGLFSWAGEHLCTETQPFVRSFLITRNNHSKTDTRTHYPLPSVRNTGIHTPSAEV